MSSGRPLMRLSHRPLTRAEALRLHEELKTTPNILGYTVRALLHLADVDVAEVGQEFAGVCFSVDLVGNWTEIAALYVLPAFRGQGIGGRLFQVAWKRAQERRRHVCVLSRNPQVIEWMRGLGMTVETRLWRAPLAVQWHMPWHMANWYRVSEGIRKRKQIKQSPPLVQGTKKFPRR